MTGRDATAFESAKLLLGSGNMLNSGIGRLIFASLAIVLGSTLAGQALALTVDAAAIGSGRGCVDASCLVQTLSQDASGGGSGSLDLGPSTVSFAVTVPLTTYLPAGADDNGVTQLDFVNVSFTGSGTTSGSPGDLSLSGTANISGDVTPFGAGTAGAFEWAVVDFTGSCTGGGSNYLCGILFSTQPDANLEINGETRYFTQTLNLTTVPEPGTALLLAGGLAFLSRRRR